MSGPDDCGLSSIYAEVGGVCYHTGSRLPETTLELYKEKLPKMVEDWLGRLASVRADEPCYVRKLDFEIIAALGCVTEPARKAHALYVERDAAEEKEQREREAEKAAREKEEAARVKAEAKRTAYGGFLACMTALAAGRAKKALGKLWRIDGVVATAAEHVERWAREQGAGLATDLSEEKRYKGASRRAYNRMTLAEQLADEERVNNSPVKCVYSVNGYDLGKTAYDYAKYLVS